MRPELESIKSRFAGKLIGNSRMQQIVCETLIHFPAEIIESITKNCWFISSFDDAWGFTLRGDELGNKHIVFLSEDLFQQNLRQQHYTIAHEIGHVILKHRNAILEPQSKGEILKQEKEADNFANDFLKNYL